MCVDLSINPVKPSVSGVATIAPFASVIILSETEDDNAVLEPLIDVASKLLIKSALLPSEPLISFLICSEPLKIPSGKTVEPLIDAASTPAKSPPVIFTVPSIVSKPVLAL